MKVSIFFAAALSSLLLLSCVHKERQPASLPAGMTDIEVQALAEMLGEDSPTAPFRHKLHVDFFTTGDKSYLGSTAKKAVAEALEKTLVEHKEGSLAADALGNLKGAFIDNFVKTLRLYKIVNTGLQLDLTLVPEANQKNNFHDELANNHLVRLDQVGGLASQLKKIESSNLMDSLYKNSSLIPKSNKADLVGGTISLYIEILDATPGFRRPSQNAVKGFIRYRRYYRMNRAFAAKKECQNLSLKVQPRNQGPAIYTVDIYKNFDLKNLLPVTETVEIFPGYLMASGEGRKEMAAFGSKEVGRTVRTTNFVIEDNSRQSVGSFYLKKLSYSLREKKWDMAASEVGPVTLNGDHSSGLSQARFKLFKQCEGSLPSYLNLSDIVPEGL